MKFVFIAKHRNIWPVAWLRLRTCRRTFWTVAAERPNQKWIADFTYIWTAEGWLYVSAVIDLFSRRVVGWSMNANMTAQLVAEAKKNPGLPNGHLVKFTKPARFSFLWIEKSIGSRSALLAAVTPPALFSPKTSIVTFLLVTINSSAIKFGWSVIGVTFIPVSA